MNGNANYAQGDISATAKSFEFQYPPTQSFYDNAKDQMILSQRNINTVYQGILPKDQEDEENPEDEGT